MDQEFYPGQEQPPHRLQNPPGQIAVELLLKHFTKQRDTDHESHTSFRSLREILGKPVEAENVGHHDRPLQRPHAINPVEKILNSRFPASYQVPHGDLTHLHDLPALVVRVGPEDGGGFGHHPHVEISDRPVMPPQQQDGLVVKTVLRLEVLPGCGKKGDRGQVGTHQLQAGEPVIHPGENRTTEGHHVHLQASVANPVHETVQNLLRISPMEEGSVNEIHPQHAQNLHLFGVGGIH